MMKRKNNLYKKITDLDVIMNMYDKVIKLNTKNKYKIEAFDRFYSQNMVMIKELLASKKYVPKKYSIFFIREPKLRIIMSQNIKDKLVNHLIAKYFLVDAFEDKLIDQNCATRNNKGTHYALRLFKNYTSLFKRNYKCFYVLKFDISKYFYNIDHDIVKSMIRKRIKDKDALDIIDKIIDSTDEYYLNKNISNLKKLAIKKIERSNLIDKEEKISEINRIPLYLKGKGFPIGNMTSQIIATFYLNDLDRYIKEELKIKYYIRYMDDGVLIHHNKEYLKYCFIKIKEFLKDYQLELNDKTRIYSSKEQIEFLGFRFCFKNKVILKVKNHTKKRFKRKMKKLIYLYKNNLISRDKVISITNSYIGHLKHGSCSRLISKNTRSIINMINKK